MPSIYTGKTTGVVNIGTVDTPLLTVEADERVVITRAVFFDITGTTVDLYESPDLTSASGNQIDQLILTANTSDQSDNLIGTGFLTGQSIIAKGVAATAYAILTYSLYTGDAV